MRALVVRSFGGPEQVEVVELDAPQPGPGQLRIRMEAAAINPVDAFVRSGAATEAGLVPARESLGLGWDVAGVVDEVGAGVIGYHVGDRVVGLLDDPDVPSGTQADLVVLAAGAVARAPRGVAPEAAATLPLNGLTAVQALAEVDLEPGRTLLVTGAAGAVGGYAVRLGSIAGLRVVAVAGATDEPLARAYGAELFVPRAADGATLSDSVRALVPGGVDGVLDAAVLGEPALAAVRDGGILAVVSGPGPAASRGILVRRVRVRADHDQLADLVGLVESGELELRVAETYRLEKGAAAHRRLAEGGLRGRLVLVP